jgi:hypothetical protein
MSHARRPPSCRPRPKTTNCLHVLQLARSKLQTYDEYINKMAVTATTNLDSVGVGPHGTQEQASLCRLKHSNDGGSQPSHLTTLSCRVLGDPLRLPGGRSVRLAGHRVAMTPRYATE